MKVFNIISRTNETRHIKWHETCKCKCRLDTNVCKSKQRWNKEKFRCECKELIVNGRCNKSFICNPSNCECECDKSCDIAAYLDYKICKCRKKIIDKSVEECNENIDGNKMIYNGSVNAIPLNDKKKVCDSCTIYVVLLIIFLLVSISISSAFIYFHWYLKKDNIHVTFNTNTQRTFY